MGKIAKNGFFLRSLVRTKDVRINSFLAIFRALSPLFPTRDFANNRLILTSQAGIQYCGVVRTSNSVRLERAYYHCEVCESGFCPRDRSLGLEDGSLSPGVLRMVGWWVRW